MADRFESYLRNAAELLRAGDFARAEGFERLARQTLETLGSPPRLLSKLHGVVGERAMRQADYRLAERAFTDAISSLREAEGGGRELFDLVHRLGLARSHQGADESALEAFDEAIAIAQTIGPAFYPVAFVHIARAESLRRLARRADAEASLRAAIAVAEHAPADGRDRIALAARTALDALRPGSVDRPGGRDRGEAADRGREHEPATAARRDDPAPRPPRAARPPKPTELRFDEAAFTAVLAELDGLIGLAAVKAEVRRLAELLRIGSLRRAAGLKTVQVSLHLVFQGGAGTGKTTVARLFGRLYKSLGLLATDRVVEVTREDLVSGYIGQTATKTAAAVDEALDGVLFLDEAYGLVRPDSQGDFGPEAVVELLKRMEDDRDRLAVIAAGYPHEMTEFLATNSGFRSRFGETIHFEDYGPAELVEIFETFATAADYELHPDARAELQRVMERLHAARDRYFGNARTARNLFDDVIAHQAERLLANGGVPEKAALVELTLADVRAASAS
jgi:tetratricopeptide (TPR) repeat protein